jgi:radical SAM protein with 4Fe4S-binding SPASM domain
MISMKISILKNFGWGSSISSALDTFSRHGGNMVRHLTPVRLANLACLSVDLALRRTIVRSRPLVIKIEPTNICNFRCPGCRTGSGQDKSPRGAMKYEDFTKIIDKVHLHALKVVLYMWGEPLINHDIFRMIKYANFKNMAVQISSNLNVFRDAYAQQIVESGLEHLIVAMDGVSQEVYEKYRVDGNVRKVVDNLGEILRMRKAMNQKFPTIELQYIVFPHNRHEIQAARELAISLGVDRMTIIDSTVNTDKSNAAMRHGKRAVPDKCNALWTLACFNWDGSFSPCCDSVDDSFGNIFKQGLDELWNSRKMQVSRSLHTRHPINDSTPTKCRRCQIYGSYVRFATESLESTPANTTSVKKCLT